MQSTRYYDYKRSLAIDLDKDGCSLADWPIQYGRALFAKHPKGFLIFLSPSELEAFDEYKESDPYGVEVNVESDFYKRRMECTLELIEEAIESVQGTPRILDLGCGQGHITYSIRQAFPEAEISGIDYSISAIEYAVEHFPGIDFIVGNAYECPYAEGYFDIIVCNNLWEHVPDPLFLLKRISNILKPCGFLIISTPSRYRLNNLIRVLVGKPVRFMSENHVTEYSVGQVLEQLRYGGYKVLKSFSKPIKMWNKKYKKNKMLFSFLAMFYSMWVMIFSILVSLTGSHHRFESTVFYLAQRANDTAVTKARPDEAI